MNVLGFGVVKANLNLRSFVFWTIEVDKICDEISDQTSHQFGDHSWCTEKSDFSKKLLRNFYFQYQATIFLIHFIC